MTDNKDSIKNKIRALLAKTTENGCTENEALAAAQMAGFLLNKYNLTMGEVELRSTKFITKRVNAAMRSYKVHAIGTCYWAIASLFDVKIVIYTYRAKPADYEFFGMPEDVDVAISVFKMMNAAYEGAVKKFKDADVFYRSLRSVRDKRIATRSFGVGFGNRLSVRFCEIKKERNADMQKAATGTALLVLKDQLVKAAAEEHYPNLKSTKERKETLFTAGVTAGRWSADKVDLDRFKKNDTLVLA